MTALAIPRYACGSCGLPLDPGAICATCTMAKLVGRRRRPRRADGRRRPSKGGRRQVIALKRRDGRRCRGCGARRGLTRDHVVPWSRGGANTLANMVLLCGPCNVLKGDLAPTDPIWPDELAALRVELSAFLGASR